MAATMGEDMVIFKKLKMQLLNYEFGNKLGLKESSFVGVDIGDMDVSIVVFGSKESGKTSLIGN